MNNKLFTLRWINMVFCLMVGFCVSCYLAPAQAGTGVKDSRLDSGKTSSGKGNSRSHQISSDRNGHVYVTWYDNRNGNRDIYFNYSDDYGVTWKANDIRLDTGDAPGARDSFSPQISSDENGHVYVIWNDRRNSNRDIYFNYSDDYGETWLANDIRLDTGDAPGANDSFFPQISSDANGHVYVIWNDRRNSNRDIYFNYSDDYGETWLANDIRLDTGDAPGANDSFFPQISSDENGHVYVTWYDDRNGNSDIYFNYSDDYGVTWLANDIRLDTGDAPGARDSSSPQISSDANGHVYVTWEDRRNSNCDIYFNYSDDYGETWQANDIRLDTGDAPGARDSFSPQISSDENGHVYVVWDSVLRDFRVGDIYFNYSDDYGVTWQANEIRLDTGNRNRSFSPQISSDANGHVFVMWARISGSDDEGETSDIYFNYSDDYGETWQANDIRLDTGDAPGARPQISSDENGHVYVAWTDNRNGPLDIYFSYSDDHGVTWQLSDIKLDTDTPTVVPGWGFSGSPQISSDGNGHVYVTWPDRRNLDTSDIYFNYSDDYGETWLANDIRLDTGDAPGANYSSHQQISSDENGHVYVTWMDHRNGHLDIYFNYSSDYGKTWQINDIRLDTGDAPGANQSSLPQISSDSNGHVYVTWHDERNGYSADIYLNYSDDYGMTWLANDIRLDTVGVRASSLQISNDDNGHIYVTWSGRQNGNEDIYFNYSDDYGVTWQTNDLRLDTGDAPGANDSFFPQISSDENGHVYVTWYDDRNGNSDIYFNYSDDYGVTWKANDIRLDTGDTPGAHNSWSPQISSDGRGHVYVTWTDYRNGRPDIYFNYSKDYGATWQTNDLRLYAADSPSTNASSPIHRISNDDNGYVYVTWHDKRNGKEGADIYFNYSNDYGVTWQANDIRLDTGDDPGAHDSSFPQISNDGNGHVYVVWKDERNANFNNTGSAISPYNTIYFNYFSVDEIITDNDFSDIGFGGTTSGTIIDSGDQELTITDEPNPAGIRIAADSSIGPKHATVGACGNNATINLDSGDEIVVTCDSGTNIDAINGTVEAIFTMPDGLFTAISVLGQGNGITFAPDTFGLKAPSSNTEAVAVVVIMETNGKWSLLSISPGQTLELIVNDLVAKEYDPVTSFNINPAPDAPAGAFTIIATFTNTSSKTIKYPFFVVSKLTGGNLLLNADDPPSGVGSILTPDVDNDVLLPGESMTVDFIIGLQDDSEFTFFTDLLGIPEP